MELSDLPIELLEMIVERCDYKSRISLNTTSTLMHHLADTAKLFIPCVTVHERHRGVRVGVLISKRENYVLTYTDVRKNWITPRKTRITQFYKADVYDERNTSAELATKFLSRVCFKKNVTIGFLSVRTVFNAKTKLAAELQKMFENTGSNPLKIETIHWKRFGENTALFDVFMNNCQPIELKYLLVNSRSNSVDLFTKHRTVISSLEKLEVFGDLDATEDDILGLRARVLHLTSDCFTNNLVQKLVDKLIQEDVPDSRFVMKRQETGLTLENIPKQFDRIPRYVPTFVKYSADRQKRVIISTGSSGCHVEVENIQNYWYFEDDLMDSYQAERRDTCVNNAITCWCYKPKICIEEGDDFCEGICFYDDSDESMNSENEGDCNGLFGNFDYTVFRL